MTERSRRLLGLSVLLGAFAGTTASAEPAAPGKPLSAPGTEAKANAAAAKAEKAEAKAERAETKAEKAEAKAERAENKAERAAALADKGSPGSGPGKSDPTPGSMDGKPSNEHAGARGSSGGPGGYRSGLWMLREGVKNGTIKKEELKGRLEKLQQGVAERRKEHREFVRTRWGSTLATEPARAELRTHEKRMAYLNRALFVAQTELSAKDQDKVIERIEKLIERENARHESSMTRMKSSSATAMGGPTPSPANPSEIGKGDVK